MTVDLFAGIAVSDFQRALGWYERLLGAEPSFLAHDTEAVWELDEHRFVVIEENHEHAGHALHTLFVSDLDTIVGEIVGRGLQPTKRETYDNGVRKVTFHDPDGNEIGFGGGPLDVED
ncbi:MAG: VOC family protein [Acidimicrobiia bacterium]|nr:VOC family protein [Acidimicrobiia bacterium]